MSPLCPALSHPSPNLLGMNSNHLSAERVIDLLRYKREHQQRRLTFDRQPVARPRLTPVMPFRTLSSKEIDHREAMIKHLTSSR